jgi:hypothetical protein
MSAWPVAPPSDTATPVRSAAEPEPEPVAVPDAECCEAARIRRTWDSGDVYVLAVHRAHCPLWSAR